MRHGVPCLHGTESYTDTRHSSQLSHPTPSSPSQSHATYCPTHFSLRSLRGRTLCHSRMHVDARAQHTNRSSGCLSPFITCWHASTPPTGVGTIEATGTAMDTAGRTDRGSATPTLMGPRSQSHGPWHTHALRCNGLRWPGGTLPVGRPPYSGVTTQQPPAYSNTAQTQRLGVGPRMALIS